MAFEVAYGRVLGDPRYLIDASIWGRTKTVEGKPSVEVIDDLCMYCANCFSVCPAMTMNDADTDGISIWVGGKVSNARTEPMFSKLAIPFLPNNPPRWPEVVEAVRRLWTA